MGHEKGAVPVSNGLSDEIAKELKKRGFKYLGTVTVYSHLQACGIINDHGKGCPCYQHIIDNYPTVRKRRFLLGSAWHSVFAWPDGHSCILREAHVTMPFQPLNSVDVLIWKRKDVRFTSAHYSGL